MLIGSNDLPAAGQVSPEKDRSGNWVESLQPHFY